MIKFEKTRVFNFDGALEGMRNSFGSHEKSDSRWSTPVHNEEMHYGIGDADLKLAKKLVKAGASHGKFLRQIMVATNITADTVWYAEFDTYKVGTTANSTSTMHTMGKGGTVSLDAFGFDNPDDQLVQKYYNEVIVPAVKEWIASGAKKPSYEWRRMIHLNARAFLYTRHVTLNYQVLRNIYQDRKNHRLGEWHDMCQWIESLPYSELITCTKDDKQKE